MSEAKSFNCPNCGSSLTANGSGKEVKCPYCGSTVIVPQELRSQSLDLTSSEGDLDSPQHLQWLIQHGADATARVDIVKDTGEIKNMNPLIVLDLVGITASGKKFETMATINVPRSAVPKRGSTINIKYNQEMYKLVEDIADFAIQINGQFIYGFVDEGLGGLA